MRATSVLLVESARTNGVSFASALQRKYEVRIAHSGKQALAMIQSSRPDVVVLDAASLRTSGNRIVAKMRTQHGELPIIHIRPQDRTRGESVADVLLTPPFTSRKLINRIERFSAAAHGNRLTAGPFCLIPEQQTLTTPTTEKKLTPKLVALMELFMQNPNVTLERRHIMQAIWNTDYMGDTRTLDVHIRWIRKVVEPDPREPQYIVTERGVGYRFQLPDGDAVSSAAQ